jgi:integrase/recombinase XerD
MRIKTNNTSFPGSKTKSVAPEIVKKKSVVRAPVQPEACPFRALIQEWLVCSSNLSPKTLLDYRDKLFKFYWWWSDYTRYSTTLGPHPKNVTPKEAREYMAYLREPQKDRWGITQPTNNKHQATLATASVASYGRTVKVFFSWLEEDQHITDTPFNKSVTEEDLTRIFASLMRPESRNTYVGCRDLAILAMLLDTGVRRGELLSITLRGLELERNRCFVSGKTGDRWVLFGDLSKRAVADYLNRYRLVQNNDPDSFLWLTSDDQVLSGGGFAMVIRRVKLATGVDFHAHKLRHTFATMMARSGITLWELKEMMGHSSITTTQIYVNEDIEKLNEVYQSRSPLTTLSNKNSDLAPLKRKRGRPPSR